MNKKYRILSFILIAGYGFFFTTKIWNIDDRPRFNSWVASAIGNKVGRIAITQVVYVSPIDAIDIILEKTSFVSNYEFELEAVVHRLDGTNEVVPLTLMSEAINMNITRQFLRIYLEGDNLYWHFVEIVLVNEIAGDRARLTMDWRMVERVDEVTKAASYDLSFDDHDLHDYSDTYYENFIPSYAPNLSLEDLTTRLDVAFTEYAIVSSLLELDPYDDILSQSVAYYKSEIKRLEALIQDYYDDVNY